MAEKGVTEDLSLYVVMPDRIKSQFELVKLLTEVAAKHNSLVMKYHEMKKDILEKSSTSGLDTKEQQASVGTETCPKCGRNIHSSYGCQHCMDGLTPVIGMPSGRRARTAVVERNESVRTTYRWPDGMTGVYQIAILALSGDISLAERDPFQNAIPAWRHNVEGELAVNVNHTLHPEGLRPGTYSVAGYYGVPGPQAPEPTILDKAYGFDWSGVGPIIMTPDSPDESWAKRGFLAPREEVVVTEGEIVNYIEEQESVRKLSLLDKLALLRQFKLYCKCVGPVPTKHADPAIFVWFCGTCKLQIIDQEND